MTYIIASVVWLTVVGLLVFRGWSTTDRSTIYAAILVGVCTTLNIDQVYLFVDGLLGNHNLADLFANTAIVVGVSVLARGVVKASGGSMRGTSVLLGWPALLITISVSVTAFFFIQTDDSSTRFMVDYGDQPAAAVYSIVQYVYFGVVLLTMAIVCLRQLSRAKGATRTAIVVLLIGSVIQIVTCMDVVFMDVAHVMHQDGLLRFGQSFYDYINMAGFSLIAIGLVLFPAARSFDGLRRRIKMARMVRILTPAWARARVSQRSAAADQIMGPDSDTESVLYRQIIEIRDAQAILGNEYNISAFEEQVLEEAEAMMLVDEPSGATSGIEDAR